MKPKVKNKSLKLRKEFLSKYKPFLIENKNLMPYRISNKQSYKTDSWFSIKYYDTNNVNKKITFNKLKDKKTFICCQKVKMLLTKTQKDILQKWFNGCTEIYNAGISYIRSNYPLFKNFICKSKINRKQLLTITNGRKLRNALVIKSKEIINNSQLEGYNKDTKIYSHILDEILLQLSSNIKSAITNTLRGNFKRFRFKYWKFTRPSHTINIGMEYIKKNKICPYKLGEIKYLYNNNKNYNLPQLNHGVKINYNRITDEYTLLIPKDVKTLKIKNRREIVALDPGLRTFMTGITQDAALKIGSNVNKTIKREITRLNKIKNNSEIKNKIKKKNEIMINRKISNKVDDLHWKSINFLTDQFSTIFLGDMSAKSIVKKNKSVLSAESKVACLRTKYYEFKQRLEYKCKIKNVNFRFVNESYTSKTCSLCGWYNNKLTVEEKFKCKECNKKMNRDINGCRNIFLKEFQKMQSNGIATIPYKLNIMNH